MEKVSDYLPGVALIAAALVVCGAWIDTAGERDARDYALQHVEEMLDLTVPTFTCNSDDGHVTGKTPLNCFDATPYRLVRQQDLSYRVFTVGEGHDDRSKYLFTVGGKQAGRDTVSEFANRQRFNGDFAQAVADMAVPHLVKTFEYRIR
jgi:hypothetical protein